MVYMGPIKKKKKKHDLYGWIHVIKNPQVSQTITLCDSLSIDFAFMSIDFAFIYIGRLIRNTILRTTLLGYRNDDDHLI